MKQHLTKSLTIAALACLLATGCKKEEDSVPSLTTIEVTEITQNTAIGGGILANFRRDEVIVEGVCWSTSPNPTVKDSITKGLVLKNEFTYKLVNLKANTTYYIRAYATNREGTGYGNTVTFNTLPPLLPVVKCNPTLATMTTAGFECVVVSDGGEPPVLGVCWGTAENPTIDGNKTEDGVGLKAISRVTGLQPNSVYYARAYATNGAGTSYSSNVTVRTMYGTVTDIDGNVYQTTLIGNQEWMAENLKVTHYRNGDPILNVTDENQWDNMVTSAYCNYNNDESISTTYGRLYNWYAAADSRGIAPAGWHIPNIAEWATLIAYLGGKTVARDKLMEVGNVHWIYNTNADNSSRFTALPGGGRASDPTVSFGNLAELGVWWTASNVESNPVVAYRYALSVYYSDVYQGTSSKRGGCSIRCVRDL